MLASQARPPSRPEELLDSSLISRLDRLDVRSAKWFPGKLQGERRSKKRGQSVEFDDYRNYVAGDDLRFIDWNVYARFDRFFIKLFLEEEDLALHIALDASPSMRTGEPDKLVFGARLAAALSYVGLVRNNRVGLSIFGAPGSRGVARLPDTRGRHNVRRAAQFILDHAWIRADRGSAEPEVVLEPEAASGQPATFNEALTTIARLRVGKGVMVVISDFLIPEGYHAGLRNLAAAGGYDTYCIQVLSPGEIEPEKETGAGAGGITGDLRLTDVETGHAAEVTVTAPLIKKYKERLARYCAELNSFCLAREMTHVLVRSDTPLETLLLETLRKRGMLG